MSNDFEKLLSGAMSSPEGSRLMGRKNELEQLINGSDAMRQTVETSARDISRAADSGDAAAMQAALKKLSSSPEGAQLISQIRKMIQG